jgi:hypothetical protein
MVRAPRQQRGGIQQLSPDPYSFCPNPWFSVTVSFASSSTSAKSYSIVDVIDQLRNQLFPLDAPINLQIKLRKIHVWERSGKALDLTVYNNVISKGQGVLTELATIRDSPGRNHWARVAYDYPLAQRVPLEPITSAVDEKLFNVETFGGGASSSNDILTYVHLSFRSAIQDRT